MDDATAQNLLRDRRRRLIRADGTVELLDVAVTMGQLKRMLNTSTIDTVALKHMGEPLMVMILVDKGWETVAVTEDDTTTLVPIAPRFPINEAATALYLANCRPGTTHRIAGDVVIAPDSDFGGPL
jgi:hypothetical protein